MEFQDTMPLGDTAPPPRRQAAATPPAAPPALAPAPATRTGPHGLAIEFTGSGSEYFRIWIVNLLLTIVTLGFYFPFAKARRLRYFHGNTLVGGHALGFHGDPWKMLRGYVLMLVFGAAYLGAGEISPIAGAVAGVAFALLWPALWQSSLRFRLANTSWRGLRLRFTGSLGGAYAALLPLLLPVAVIVAAGALSEQQDKEHKQDKRAAVSRVVGADAGAIAEAAERLAPPAAGGSDHAADHTAEGAAGALFLGTGLVHGEGAAAEVGAVHLLGGQLGLLGGAHGDEREAAGAAGHLVHGDVGVGHGAELAEVGAELVIGGLEGEVSNVEFGVAHVIIRRSVAICQSVPNLGFEIIT